ncbi:FAD-dependent monooxygenase [Phytoactinopolyspora limicola]|uniref:FAD-dependent monooxygenase n=1 Tax=Phytoactinopolyspora limicola TaxID=2715536 RepID=UPI00140C8FF7|nr:FAD-dependent monooxygenase [Phytoactinopolyspora limicola]
MNEEVTDVKVRIIGGGPGGLYLAALVREAVPQADVVVFERNRPDETYGFGVVFSQPTLRHLREHDHAGFERLFSPAVRWPGIDIHIGGRSWRCGGHGFAAIERRLLLAELAERARRAGAELRYETTVDPGSAELADADVVVVANGANSAWRTTYAGQLGATVDTATAKFIWFGTTHVFDGMTFLFEENEHGWFAAHAYPYSPERSTFVVETDHASWRAAGLDGFDTEQPPGPSDAVSAAYAERLFARHLGSGRLVVNNSRWASFRTVRTGRWIIDDRTVLLGDAAHTAHFSVGSGTKMAMEDALSLAGHLTAAATGHISVGAALHAYQADRQPEVRRIQDAARPSLSWWEHFGEYATLPPAQFALHFLTRSGRVGRHRLQRSDPEFLGDVLTELLGDADAAALNRPLTLHSGHPLPHRLVALDPAGGGRASANSDDATPHLADLGSSIAPGHVAHSSVDGGAARVAWCCAPADPAAVPAFVEAQTSALLSADLIVVEAADADESGGPGVDAQLAQQRVAEILRLRLGRTVALVRRDITADDAAALVLAGRTDLIAVPTLRVAELLADDTGDASPAAALTPPTRDEVR